MIAVLSCGAGGALLAILLITTLSHSWWPSVYYLLLLSIRTPKLISTILFGLRHPHPQARVLHQLTKVDMCTNGSTAETGDPSLDGSFQAFAIGGTENEKLSTITYGEESACLNTAHSYEQTRPFHDVCQTLFATRADLSPGMVFSLAFTINGPDTTWSFFEKVVSIIYHIIILLYLILYHMLYI